MYEELIGALKKCGYPGDVHYCRDCFLSDSGRTCHMKKLLPAAAEAIEELEKSIPRWIPVTERLPQDEETVFTWGNQETILLDWRHDNKWCCFGEVTHWIPLPEPPREET